MLEFDTEEALNVPINEDAYESTKHCTFISKTYHHLTEEKMLQKSRNGGSKRLTFVGRPMNCKLS